MHALQISFRPVPDLLVDDSRAGRRARITAVDRRTILLAAAGLDLARRRLGMTGFAIVLVGFRAVVLLPLSLVSFGIFLVAEGLVARHGEEDERILWERTGRGGEREVGG
jgi:hypothetical protein